MRGNICFNNHTVYVALVWKSWWYCQHKVKNLKSSFCFSKLWFCLIITPIFHSNTSFYLPFKFWTNRVQWIIFSSFSLPPWGQKITFPGQVANLTLPKSWTVGSIWCASEVHAKALWRISSLIKSKSPVKAVGLVSIWFLSTGEEDQGTSVFSEASHRKGETVYPAINSNSAPSPSGTCDLRLRYHLQCK